MPSSRGKLSPSRTAVEAKPSSSTGRSSTLSPPSSPKAVHFAPRTSDLVSGVSRALTPAEAWSLYHFEMHARACSSCYNPLDVYLKGRHLCPHGLALAQDVAIHVYYQAGEFYSTTTDDTKLVRVELQPKYDHTRNLLRSIERARTSRRRNSSTISHESTSSATQRRPASIYKDERGQLHIRPSSSTERPQQHSAGKSTSPTFYSTVVVPDSASTRTRDLPTRSKVPQRRDSVHDDSDFDRRRASGAGYRTEICTPEWEDRKKDSRRRSRA